MRSPEVASLLNERPTDVLIPLGALEQHGPHLPLGTDTVIAEEIAHRVARKVGDLAVAPCLPIGCSDHHLDFAGTASLPADVLARSLSSMAVTLLGHGFRYVFLVSGHAGNIPAMEDAVENVPAELQGRVVALADWPAQRKSIHRWAEAALGIVPEEVGSHAGHYETSIMLRLAPESVDMSVAPVGFIGSAESGARLMHASGMSAVSDVGVMGDTRSACAAAGDGYLELLADSVGSFVEKYRASTTEHVPDRRPSRPARGSVAATAKR